ncbi:MFS transporter [Bartonella sp. LJL80]
MQNTSKPKISNGIDRSTSRRAVIAASLGNALEWYDFAIYALFAIYIAQNFFPSDNDTSELIKAFLAFGLGFIIRPVGAIVLGIYADKAGRKAALTLTIMVMAAGTLIIAIAPTYAAIGIGAPLLLLAGRLLQGFSSGGELGGAAAFLVEHAPAGERGKYSAWLQASMSLSNIMSALVALAVTTWLTHDQILHWGWRVPFLIGLLIAPVGLWMRRTLKETPVFEETQKRQTLSAESTSPLKEVFRGYWQNLIKGIAISILWGIAIYSLIVYMPVYIQRTFAIAGNETFLASFIGNIVMVFTCVYSGHLSDRFGRKGIMLIAAFLLGVCVFPLLWLLQIFPTLLCVVFVQTCFCIMVGFYSGVAAVAISELFPPHIRSTGMSLSYNAAFTIFGGFAPAILTWFSKDGGIYAPAWYAAAGSICAIVALLVRVKSAEA